MMTKIKLSGLLVYIILTFPFCIYSTHENNITKRESQPRTFSSGCNDAFSVFGFLAFLLALLDLIMELNATPAPVGRKKRFSSDNLVKNANEHRTDWKKENEGEKIMPYSLQHFSCKDLHKNIIVKLLIGQLKILEKVDIGPKRLSQR